MIGSTYTRKADKHVFRITAGAGESFVLQDETEFSSPIAVTLTELRRDFQKATEAVAIERPTEDEGWRRLSAEQKLAALASAADTEHLTQGDVNPFTGDALDADDIGRLRGLASKLSGRRAPAPEQVFATDQKAEIKAAADKIWNSDGPDGLLASFEIGELEVGPQVARDLDRRIARRNAQEDRQNYPNNHRIAP